MMTVGATLAQSVITLLSPSPAPSRRLARATSSEPPQRKNPPSASLLEDKEIGFGHVLREKMITVPKPVSWTAH